MVCPTRTGTVTQIWRKNCSGKFLLIWMRLVRTSVLVSWNSPSDRSNRRNRWKAQTDDLHHRQLHLGGKLYLRSLQGSLGHWSFLQGDQADSSTLRLHWLQRERGALANMDGSSHIYFTPLYCMAEWMEAYFYKIVHCLARSHLALPGYGKCPQMLWDSIWLCPYARRSGTGIFTRIRTTIIQLNEKEKPEMGNLKKQSTQAQIGWLEWRFQRCMGRQCIILILAQIFSEKPKCIFSFNCINFYLSWNNETESWNPQECFFISLETEDKDLS